MSENNTSNPLDIIESVAPVSTQTVQGLAPSQLSQSAFNGSLKKDDKSTLIVYELCKKIAPRVFDKQGNPAGLPPPPRRIKNPCEVFDVDKGYRRMMRLVRGEKSIWADEQKIPTESLSTALIEIVFSQGYYSTYIPINQNYVEFLNRHDDNEANPFRISEKAPVFRIVDAVIMNKSKEEILDIKGTAWQKAKDVSDEEMMLHAKFLKIPFKDEHGRIKETQTIRIAYREFADTKPALFMQSFGDPNLKVRAKIQDAIEKGVIDLHYEPGTARWTSTKGLIMRFSGITQPVDQLTAFAVTKEGEDFTARL